MDYMYNMNKVNKVNVTKKVIFRVDADKIKAIKRIALETDKSLAQVYNEGVEFVLDKYKHLLT